MEEIRKPINHDELRKVNLEAIKSIKNHLHKPKKWENLYYIPVYEKGLILTAVKMLKELYFEPDTDIAALNNRIGIHVKSAREEMNGFKRNFKKSGDNSGDDVSDTREERNDFNGSDNETEF